MDDLRIAQTIIDAALVSGRITPAKSEHLQRVKALAADFGALPRDQAVALLHESDDVIDDHPLSAPLKSRLRHAQSCLADFLAQDDLDLQEKLETLAVADQTIKMIWLFDVIDSFEHPIIALPVRDADLVEILEQRCILAISSLTLVSPYRTLKLIDRARDAIMTLSMRASAGLI